MLKLKWAEAFIALNNEQTVCLNRRLLFLSLKVIQSVKTEIPSSLIIIKDYDNLVLEQFLLFVLGKEITISLKDDEGQNSLPFGINALSNCCLLLVA
jgi:hypothetical protein